eukprot:gnl/TRDRNA2_/TRDRNA2_79672_c3_seq1.p1 gnl/TRDRNA2_/TRDRNA2_79672_c3~~gnl/TRDRNA2_/TRDRNA2_79672_c3_seq1.p1  ORF type:complete len:124 (+),score=7.13 gnl/TRDRNA2_/TRDRNA2_79672_c3_seq1:2-373(+)
MAARSRFIRSLGVSPKMQETVPPSCYIFERIRTTQSPHCTLELFLPSTAATPSYFLCIMWSMALVAVPALSTARPTREVWLADDAPLSGGMGDRTKTRQRAVPEERCQLVERDLLRIDLGVSR